MKIKQRCFELGSCGLVGGTVEIGHTYFGNKIIAGLQDMQYCGALPKKIFVNKECEEKTVNKDPRFVKKKTDLNRRDFPNTQVALLCDLIEVHRIGEEGK